MSPENIVLGDAFFSSAGKITLDNMTCVGYLAVHKLQGGIAKWSKAAVCKTAIRGFESRSRLSRNQG